MKDGNFFVLAALRIVVRYSGETQKLGNGLFVNIAVLSNIQCGKVKPKRHEPRTQIVQALRAIELGKAQALFQERKVCQKFLIVIIAWGFYALRALRRRFEQGM